MIFIPGVMVSAKACMTAQLGKCHNEMPRFVVNDVKAGDMILDQDITFD
jgi:hypothetical protein